MQNDKNFKIIEIRNNSVKVSDNNGMTLLVSKYKDSEGVYILNQDLEKQYVTMPEKRKTKVSNTNNYQFMVSYWVGENLRTSFKNIKAKDFETAEKRIEKSFKRIMDYSTY